MVVFTFKRSIWQFLHILLSSVHFVLYGALFVHPTLERTFCAVWSTFCTSYSRACILYCMEHFLHIPLSCVHFVLYMAVFIHHTLKHTFCAQNTDFLHLTLKHTFCALNFFTSHSQVYILCRNGWCMTYSKCPEISIYKHAVKMSMSGYHQLNTVPIDQLLHGTEHHYDD